MFDTLIKPLRARATQNLHAWHNGLCCLRVTGPWPRVLAHNTLTRAHGKVRKLQEVGGVVVDVT